MVVKEILDYIGGKMKPGKDSEVPEFPDGVSFRYSVLGCYVYPFEDPRKELKPGETH